MVAPYIVPEVVVQVVPEVKVTAAAQLSLTGAGSSTHIVKLPVVVVEYALTR
jgi:hypothetical protein